VIENVVVNKPTFEYKIFIENGLLVKAGEIIRTNIGCEKIMVLTNEILYDLYYKRLEHSLESAGIEVFPIVLPDGEKYKDLKSFRYIIDRLVLQKINRESGLVTFGGGVIGDLGGFAAASYMRGIYLIHIPTTLLAQIDSSIGGKTALDHILGKNLIGAFYNPHMVLTDPELLTTLSESNYLCGLFEAIKIALIGNRELYRYISENIDEILEHKKDKLEYVVAASAREKIKIVSDDPYESSLRMILNFGHTFGHALEAVNRYKDISHGEAVGYGMLVALKLSESMAGLDLKKNEDVYKLIYGLLPKREIKRMDSEKLWEAIALDKKKQAGSPRFVLLEDIAKPVIKEVSRELFFKTVSQL
jgi:3-dehydroquinate synthase